MSQKYYKTEVKKPLHFSHTFSYLFHFIELYVKKISITQHLCPFKIFLSISLKITTENSMFIKHIFIVEVKATEDSLITLKLVFCEILLFRCCWYFCPFNLQSLTYFSVCIKYFNIKLYSEFFNAFVWKGDLLNEIQSS